MMKAQEDTNMSYQKKKVHTVSLSIRAYTCHSVLVGRDSLLVRCSMIHLVLVSGMVAGHCR